MVSNCPACAWLRPLLVVALAVDAQLRAHLLANRRNGLAAVGIGAMRPAICLRRPSGQGVIYVFHLPALCHINHVHDQVPLWACAVAAEPRCRSSHAVHTACAIHPRPVLPPSCLAPPPPLPGGGAPLQSMQSLSLARAPREALKRAFRQPAVDRYPVPRIAPRWPSASRG